jgi:hypothetical protein
MMTVIKIPNPFILPKVVGQKPHAGQKFGYFSELRYAEQTARLMVRIKTPNPLYALNNPTPIKSSATFQNSATQNKPSKVNVTNVRIKTPGLNNHITQALHNKIYQV